MRSYPTKSPAATCTLDTGFQIEWHPETTPTEADEDALSVCSSCSCSESGCGSRHGSTYSLARSESYHPTGEGEQNTLLASTAREIVVQTSTAATPNSTVDSNLPPSRTATTFIPKLCHCCHACNRAKWLLAASGLMLCELIPWIVGFTLIIYFYRILGVGPGMGILLVMVVLHGLLRFLKAHGDLDCYKHKLKKKQTAFIGVSQIPQNAPDVENPPNSPGEEESVPEPNHDPGIISEVLIHPQELPPSYEAAVTKPPPYDLNRHLKPNNETCVKLQYLKNVKDPRQNNISDSSSLPLQVLSSADCNTDDDLFLPSYQDVIENFKAHSPDPSELSKDVLVTDL